MVKCAKTYPFENLKPFKCKRLKWRPLEQRASGSAQRAQPPPSTLQAGARARSTEIVHRPQSFPAARPGFVSRTVSVPLRLTFSPLITPLSLVEPGAGPWSRLLDAMLLALSRSPVADLSRSTMHVARGRHVLGGGGVMLCLWLCWMLRPGHFDLFCSTVRLYKTVKHRVHHTCNVT